MTENVNCEGEENTHMWRPYPWRGVVGWSCVSNFFFCILVIFFEKKSKFRPLNDLFSVLDRLFDGVIDYDAETTYVEP